MSFAVPGYGVRRGALTERSLLIQFLRQTYAEVANTQHFSHLAEMVDHHLSAETPLWWVETIEDSSQTVACLWLGNAIDQQTGDRQSYVLML